MTIQRETPLRVLIGYECSGAVRRAFRRLGFDAWSCDIQASRDDSEYHYEGDIWAVLEEYPHWDFAVFHPPCTYLTNSAAWAFKDPDFDKHPGVGYHQKVKPGTLTGQARRDARDASLEEVARLIDLPFPKVIENPRGFIGTMLTPATQTIQPYEYGSDASKATCLWNRPAREGGAVPPALKPTYYIAPRIVGGKERWSNQTDSGQNRLSPSDNRADERSETFPGIASAMAAQWGGWLLGKKLPDHHLNYLLETEALLA
ncbi:DNA methyltransferase [Ruegeria phage DSS3-P1]|uniref:DNA methyltransferase n=1 Tax=Ruegeria phage DSS3-P1 TaxID=1555208 RepID=UPI0002357D34|nr:DNA methyltransferase [Ruegeria phage DSS3-P1]YP_009997211.1 DNA methyltransferase [Ruegeria phage vB_RpoS-V16]YP_009997292.1 DNA methyltransferase [Ruegeria phage vB_RpoS-V18]YP_009997374.1 DNA methyltransferase [Ruegeria phage vB_RpoS-V11]YP_009997458.1 DNA methyltransferase [Ruegeria phage vB_RpoS-V7]AET42286.1 hypothetical protein SDSG_00020 [Ruegeria phage DSS3-P1]AIT13310.1 hypothetical protein DSS3P1_75 [Ruegeria phage DSS3-P1]AWY08780.1 hypothetical protein vBRpoSV7_77 [Ruegeria p